MSTVVIDLDELTGGPAAHRTSASNFFSTATERPVLMHMLSFLDTKSLAAVCEANHPHLSPLASSNELWRPAYARDFVPALQDDANYKRLYLDAVDARQRQIKQMEEYEKNMLWQERWDECYVCCFNSFLHLTPMVCVPLALIIFTAVVAVYVDKSSSVSLGSAFIPLYIVMAALAIVFVCLCWSRSEEKNWYYNSESFVKDMCLEPLLGARTWSSYALTVIAFAGVLLTLIFIHLRVTAQISWSWTFVFLPLWFAMSTVCCMIPARCFSDDEEDLPIWQFMAIVAVVPLLVFTILLVLRLNGSDMPLKYVFIPLWLFDSSLVIACVAVIASSLHESFDGLEDITEKPCEFFFSILASLCALALVSTLALFKAFLASNDAGSTSLSLSVVMIPLWIFLGLAFLVCCFGSVQVILETHGNMRNIL